MLPFRYRQVIALSEFFRAAADIVPGLLTFADSLYVISQKSSALACNEPE
jgi:hypothetical protein